MPLASIVLDDGRVFSVWRTDGPFSGESYIRGRALNTDGSASAPDFLIVSEANSVRPFGSTWEPELVQLGNGAVMVTWSANYGDRSGGAQLGRLFDPNGTPLTNEFVVPETTKNSQRIGQFWERSDGSALVTWTTLHYTGSLINKGDLTYGRLVNADGRPSGPEFALDEAWDAIEFRIARGLDNGNVLMIYQQPHIDPQVYTSTTFARIISPTGQVVVPEIVIDDADNYDSVDFRTTQLNDGSTLLTWVSVVLRTGLPAETTFMGRLLGATGEPIGQAFSVGEQHLVRTGSRTLLQLPDGQIIMVYSKEQAAKNYF